MNKSVQEELRNSWASTMTLVGDITTFRQMDRFNTALITILMSTFLDGYQTTSCFVSLLLAYDSLWEKAIVWRFLSAPFILDTLYPRSQINRRKTDACGESIHSV